MKMLTKIATLLILPLLASYALAEQVCTFPPPQAIASDVGQFKICAEILTPELIGTQLTISGWSGWIHNNGLKENRSVTQTWESDLDGYLGVGEKIIVNLSPGTHTITLTLDPGIINYELKTTLSVTVEKEKTSASKP